MRKKNQESSARSRLLVLVDESNVSSSVRTAGRGLDWLKLRDFLAGPNTERDLIEMVVYAGLPPAIPIWQDERDRKNKFVHWLRSNGFMGQLMINARASGLAVAIFRWSGLIQKILRSFTQPVLFVGNRRMEAKPGTAGAVRPAATITKIFGSIRIILT